VTSDEQQRARAALSEPSLVTGHSSPFFWPVRVYWEDTDAGGIVYYANYLKFMERARSEWLRAQGIEQGPLQREQGIIFVVVSAETYFRKPARYGDLLQVTCEVEKQTKASLTFRQEVIRAEGESTEILVTGTVRVACLDAEKFRPRALPDNLLRSEREGKSIGEGNDR
jgi:acyl-CoA thioester hydrolase